VSGGQALESFAQRVVRGAVAALAVATVAATVVGFWLSYAGLHAFAVRSGLRGPEAWAWPASVDLFILAGELGVTISAIRRQRDPLAWCYLLAGFGPSVAFNVLHVDPAAITWGRYAVAAVPPVAAMLALAALMRQVFRLAMDAHLAGVPEAVPAAPGPGSNGTGPHPEVHRIFAGEIATRRIPSIRRIRRELHVGQPRAQEVRGYLETLTRT
jgi:Protein of unknown function (DUF2637)